VGMNSYLFRSACRCGHGDMLGMLPDLALSCLQHCTSPDGDSC